MEIQVNANYISIVSKMNKIATGDVKTFKGQLDKIRIGLSASYNGSEDISADILVLEKKLDEFSTKMSSLSTAFNQGASAILESANKAVNIGELAPLSKELEFVLSNPTTAQMIERNKQILQARALTESFKNNSLLTSMFGKRIAGGLFAGASAIALLPLLNTDNTKEGVDNFYKNNYSAEYKEAEAEIRRMQNNYRETTEWIQKSFPDGQKQVYRMNKKGVKTGGICNVAAMERLLDRRCVLDGHSTDTFNAKDVINQSGAKVTENPLNGGKPTDPTTGKKKDGIGYEYTGSTSSACCSKYTNGDVSYQAKVAYTSFSSLDKCNSSLTALLDEHPEGLYIHMNNGKDKQHAVVLTDYTVNEKGEVSFYFSDSWGKNSRGAAPHNLISQTSMNGTDNGSLKANVTEDNWYKYIDTVSYLK